MEQEKKVVGRPKGTPGTGGRSVGYRAPVTKTTPGVSLVVRVPDELHNKVTGKYGRKLPGMVRGYLETLVKGATPMEGTDCISSASSTNMSIRMKRSLKRALVYGYGGDLSSIIRIYLLSLSDGK